jgi:hypothetical protein
VTAYAARTLQPCAAGPHPAELVPGTTDLYVYAGHGGAWAATCAAHSGLCHDGCWDPDRYPDLRARIAPAPEQAGAGDGDRGGPASHAEWLTASGLTLTGGRLAPGYTGMVCPSCGRVAFAYQGGHESYWAPTPPRTVSP